MRCFIIANGPSIKGQDLTPLRDEVCITADSFFAHPDFGHIKPRYHCAEAFGHPHTEESWDMRMQSLDQAARRHNPDITLLFPLADIKRNSRTGTFTHFQPYYLDLSVSMDNVPSNGIDLCKAILSSRSVTVTALQAAIYMGFTEIYLLGCEHDRLPHIDQSRYSKSQYNYLKDLARRNGVSIYSIAGDGAPDVFPRAVLEEVATNSCLRRMPGQYGFFGDFASWEEAVAQTEGYDAPQILEKVKNATLLVKSCQAAYERDSVVFDAIPYEWIAPLAAWLPRIALEYGNRLNILDFGGSLGSTYFALRQSLRALENITWSVVEQSSFVECGNSLIADGSLRFYQTIDSCVLDRNPPIILLSAALEYIEQPYSLIAKIIEYGFDYIIFDRTPLVEGGRDLLTVQFVSPEIYAASYPAWFFSREKFLKAFEGAYEIVMQFDAQDRVNIPSSFEGFIFRKIVQDRDVWGRREQARYDQAGDLLRQSDSLDCKRTFLEAGCRTEQEYNALSHKRELNRQLTEMSVHHQLPIVKNKPTYAIFEMSSTCNLACTLCNTGGLKKHFSYVRRGVMPFEIFKAGLDKLLPEIESLLLYNWGEPFINTELFDCIEYATRHYVHTQLSTNMMLYTEEIGNKLIQSGLSKLIVSCDGLDQETYEAYRKGGSLQKVINCVDNLILQKRSTGATLPVIEIQFIVFRHNENQLQEFEVFWKSRGVDAVTFIQMSYMSKHGQELAERLGFVPNRPDYQPYHPYGTMKRCADFYNQVSIDWNGDWYTCCFPSGMPEYRVGNIVCDDFWSTWNNEKYRYCRDLVRNQKSGEGYCETMCHDCVGIFPRSDTRRYWHRDDAVAQPVAAIRNSSSLLPLAAINSLLEIGFVAGFGFQSLCNYSPSSFHYTGIDADDIKLAIERMKYPEADFFPIGGNTLFFDNRQFDCVIVSANAVSFHDNGDFLYEIARVADDCLVLNLSGSRDTALHGKLTNFFGTAGFEIVAAYEQSAQPQHHIIVMKRVVQK